IGFLRAPVSYEVVRSHYVRLDQIDLHVVNTLLEEMSTQAREVVALATEPGSAVEGRTVFMRYSGQGHEISVTLPARRLDDHDRERLRADFEAAYAALYTRAIPGAAIEALTWVVTLSTPRPPVETLPVPEPGAAEAREHREVFDPAAVQMRSMPVYARETLAPGSRLSGPALIVEPQTTTFVSRPFDARVDARGYIVMERKPGE
ncbi:MAG: hydantoinase/oxoprolinase family protein, partial [Gammaproteobacteria bacterium]|nr:hydantoinase/oxoprolinase family protein [Gammaproteobacteria bacterium]